MRTGLKTLTMLIAAALIAAACGGGTDDVGGAPEKVTIAVGSGIAYAPLTLMKHEKSLEKRFPKTDFVWNEGVSGGAATRDGMLGQQVQVGVAGIAPFLIGRDKGVKWKVLGSMGQLSIDLETIDPKIRSLRDLAKSGKSISLPSPDSGQAIALKALGEDVLGDPKAFDDQFAPMGHPDAFQALVNGTTGAAFIGPPFQYQLVEQKGARRLASATDAFGQMTYSAVVLTEDFYKDYPKFSRELFDALEESLTMLRDRPDEAAQILAELEGGDVTPAQYEKWLTKPETQWSSAPRGYMKNAKFMKKVGLISKAPSDASDLMFPTVADEAK